MVLNCAVVVVVNCGGGEMCSCGVVMVNWCSSGVVVVNCGVVVVNCGVVVA